MTTIDQTLTFTSKPASYCKRLAGGLRFDLPATLLAQWLTVGTFLDGFAHHNLPESLETFFTPWHGVLYAGFLALAGFILFHQFRNMANGYAWNSALPAGYSFTLVGIAVFGLSGLGDFIWHTLFGIEEGVEALLSPTHLMLAAGGLLLVSSPLRAALRRFAGATKPGWKNLFPALLSAMLVLSVLMFFTEYANTIFSPEQVVENPLADTPELFVHYLTAVGVAGVLIPTAFVIGAVLFIIRRWTLPIGALTLIVSGSGLLMALFHYHEMMTYPQVLIPIAGGGLIAELAYAWLRPSAEREREMRVFSFVVPLALYAVFFTVLVLTTGVWWSIHMWTGVPFMAGVVGLLTSLATASSARAPSTCQEINPQISQMNADYLFKNL
ncbi:MAG TPA: hypothetical protein VJ020_12220 [Anaerolineales bacterium]|nr:hypothetical protein [Anaerolineales bacterium]